MDNEYERPYRKTRQEVEAPMGAGDTFLKIGKMFYWPAWCLQQNLFRICGTWAKLVADPCFKG